MVSSVITGFIRTFVPILVGTVVAYLARRGLNINQAEVNNYLIPLAIGGYYTLARAIELKFPQLGWLLGAAKQPIYVPDQTGYRTDSASLAGPVVANITTGTASANTAAGRTRVTVNEDTKPRPAKKSAKASKAAKKKGR